MLSFFALTQMVRFWSFSHPTVKGLGLVSALTATASERTLMQREYYLKTQLSLTKSKMERKPRRGQVLRIPVSVLTLYNFKYSVYKKRTFKVFAS